MDCYQLSNPRLHKMVDELVKFSPVLISGYTTSLLLIGRLLKKQGIRLPKLRAIQPTAELVTKSIEEKLQQDFGCLVLNKYGCRESNMIAHQSPVSDQLLIQAENVFLEFLRPDGSHCRPGEKGQIVVTTLNNFSMPLIRYQLGDIGTFTEECCPSGRGLPVMKEIDGRKHEVILTPSGDFVHPQLFSNIFMTMREVHWFQIIQTKLDALNILIIKNEGWTQKSESLIRTKITQFSGFPFELIFEFTDDIPASITGKHPLCVQRIPEFDLKFST